jgi:hypothetical protein
MMKNPKRISLPPGVNRARYPTRGGERVAVAGVSGGRGIGLDVRLVFLRAVVLEQVDDVAELRFQVLGLREGLGVDVRLVASVFVLALV